MIDLRPAMLAAALALTGASASAQTIYRCGNEYTRIPCAEGKAVDPDRRSAARVAEGRQVSEQERRLGNDMARDRRQREASLRPAAAASLGPRKPATGPLPAASASLKPKKKAKGKMLVVDERDFIAAVPKIRKGESR